MRLRARLFGALADRVGARQVAVEFAHAPTASDVVLALGELYPVAAPLLEQVSVAVNLELVPASTRIREGDEVALLPPTAGGATSITVGLRECPSVYEAIACVADPTCGGTAVFVGTVRDHSEAGAVECLEYCAYDEMAQKVLRDIVSQAARDWGLGGVAVLHGVGRKGVGDVTVVVACSAAHRGEALEACRFVVDEVKRRVPVWKKESGPWGERWVNA